MHRESRRGMRDRIGKYLKSGMVEVADLGSFDVNGTYRPLIEPDRSYTGIDIEAGKNVDVVITDYHIPVEDNHFDALISGQCFEHVKNPFKLMAEVGRVVKPGGIVIVVAPFKWEEHRYPVDCWRILSDGWKALFNESGIYTLDTEYTPAGVVKRTGEKNVDSWAIGVVTKP